MATTDKYLDQNGLLYLNQKYEGRYAKASDLTTTNSNLSTLEETVSGIVAEGGEPNVIETVQVNGSPLTVTNKTVNVPVPTNNNQLTNGAGYATTSELNTGLGGKQDTLTFDNSPTANSNNPVKSGGVLTALNAKAPLASPALTGTPTAPTASAGTNSTQIATTEFVNTAIGALDTGVTSVNNQTGAVTLDAGDVGAYTTTQVDNKLAEKQNTLTFDSEPISASTNPVTSGGVFTALGNKVDKVTGKGLSTNDFTDTLQTKLNGIAAGAQVNVIETVQVNGTALTPSSKTVNVQVPTTVAQLTDASNYALKSDLTNVYKYKGSVATENDLPSTGNTAGDIYDVQATGTNYAWTGTAWDALGQLFTITSITNAEIDTILGY